MNVTKITIGRLYNLGNYEHVRYDLTVEVKDGESAATAILGMEKILAGLAPLKNACIKSAGELQRLANEVEEMKTMPVVDWERRYGHCKGSAAEVIDRYQKSLEEEAIKSQAAIDRARKARKLLDDLGGAAQWKDAKLDWDDYNDEGDY
jgi:hypothetical protein